MDSLGTSISSILTITTPPLGIAPSPATALSISNISASSLTFSWSAPLAGSLPFQYQPQISLSGSGVWSNIGGLIPATTVDVSLLSPNTGYSFQVLTSNSTGTSASATVSATTLAVAAGEPTGLSVVGAPTDTTVNLQWNAPTVGTTPFTYQVAYRTPSGSGAFTPFPSTTTALTQTITGLTPGSGYDFEVTASNAAGAGPVSAVLSNVQTTGTVVNAPGPATGLAVSNLSSTTLTLSWTAPTTGAQPFTYQPQASVAGGGFTNIGASVATLTANIAGLTPATVYQFQIVTSNATPSTSTSASVSATTLSVLPGAPTGFAVVGSPTQTSISLQWIAPAVGTTPFTYQVLSALTGSGTFAAAASNTTALTQTITGLLPGVGYDLEVNASNAAGTGPASAVLVNVATAASAPGSATALIVSALTPTSLTLSWTAPSTGSPPFAYQVQISVSGGAFSNIGSSVTVTTESLSGLSANTSYQFQVITTNPAGSSTSSPVSQLTPSVLPAAPTALAVAGTPTTTAIALQWVAPAVGTVPFTYQVLSRTPTGSGTFAAAGASTTSLTQTITGLAPGTGYDFEVTAANPAGTGPASTVLVNAQTAPGSLGSAPAPATALVFSAVTDTTLTLSWTAPVTGTAPFTYQIQAASGGGGFANTGGTTGSTTGNVTGLTANTAYQFQVVTTNTFGSSTSASSSVTTLQTLPGAPTSLALGGSATQTSVSLQWVAPVTGTTPFTYQVLSRSPTGVGSYVNVGSVVSALAETITGLTAATSYDFEVTAINGAGTGPASSALTNVLTPGVVAGPATGLVVSSLAATTLTLSWTAPTLGTLPFSYQVQQATGGGAFVNTGGSIGVTTENITGLTANTTYQFQVITTNSAGSSTSASIGTTTLSILPGAPTGLALTGSPTTTTVSLQWVAPVAGTAPFSYQVLSRTPTGSGSFTAAGATVSTLTQIISGLVANTSYDFEVTATNGAGTGPASSVLLNVVTAVDTTPVAPSAPTNLTAGTPTTTTIPVSWTAPAVGTPPLSYVVQYRLH